MLEMIDVGMSFNLKGRFFQEEKKAVVIRKLNLEVGDNEIIAVVGESGCGKTTVGKIITGLLKPTSGKVLFNGEDIRREKKRGKSEYRRGVQFIQQDSYAALNPVKTIYQSLLAALETFDPTLSKTDKLNKIEETMTFVGLNPFAQFAYKYPHQLSGGQRQRCLMARALLMQPKLIVADEPVSMIDVSLRISILNLIGKLNRELNIAFVYITHDLATAKYIAGNGRICVMYLGDIVELGSIEQVLFHPRHPYTQALVSAVPIPNPELAGKHKMFALKSMEMTKLTERVIGCAFASRCPYADEGCTGAEIEYADADGVAVKCRRLDIVPQWE